MFSQLCYCCCPMHTHTHTHSLTHLLKSSKILGITLIGTNFVTIPDQQFCEFQPMVGIHHGTYKLAMLIIMEGGALSQEWSGHCRLAYCI